MSFVDSVEAEHVTPIDLGVIWEPNVPDPILLQTEGKAYLLLYPWEASERYTHTVVIEWQSCRGAVFGDPNDEAFYGHRLYDKGLQDILWAGEVHKSGWIAAGERVNSVHPRHDPERFANARHFILRFKDSTFECIAEGYTAGKVAEPMAQMVQQLLLELIP